MWPIATGAVEWRRWPSFPTPKCKPVSPSFPAGTRAGTEIVKSFERASFPDAVAFVVRVGFLAEKADHHPDIDIRWRTVRLALTSHDSGGLTASDLRLANEIEEVAS